MKRGIQFINYKSGFDLQREEANQFKKSVVQMEMKDYYISGLDRYVPQLFTYGILQTKRERRREMRRERERVHVYSKRTLLIFMTNIA